jgi:hypothetical protein
MAVHVFGLTPVVDGPSINDRAKRIHHLALGFCHLAIFDSFFGEMPFSLRRRGLPLQTTRGAYHEELDPGFTFHGDLVGATPRGCPREKDRIRGNQLWDDNDCGFFKIRT